MKWSKQQIKTLIMPWQGLDYVIVTLIIII